MIGMKLSGVTKLVPSNFWVGCTPAQSQQGRPWPAPRPFCQKSISSMFLMLPGHVIPFWKGFDRANNMGGEEFCLGAHMGSCGC